jgi:hypothetical protein
VCDIGPLKHKIPVQRLQTLVPTAHSTATLEKLPHQHGESNFSTSEAALFLSTHDLRVLM